VHPIVSSASSLSTIFDFMLLPPPPPSTPPPCPPACRHPHVEWCPCRPEPGHRRHLKPCGQPAAGLRSALHATITATGRHSMPPPRPTPLDAVAPDTSLPLVRGDRRLAGSAPLPLIRIHRPGLWRADWSKVGRSREEEKKVRKIGGVLFMKFDVELCNGWMVTN
jgi:hypothetical protein